RLPRFFLPIGRANNMAVGNLVRRDRGLFVEIEGIPHLHQLVPLSPIELQAHLDLSGILPKDVILDQARALVGAPDTQDGANRSMLDQLNLRGSESPDLVIEAEDAVAPCVARVVDNDRASR